jgi:hypothetical protein
MYYGPEMTAKMVRYWLAKVGTKTLFIEPDSPWENGFCESFNGKLRDELLNGKLFYSLKEAQVVIEQWRRHYDTQRPHSSLGYQPPASAATLRSPLYLLNLKTCTRLQLSYKNWTGISVTSVRTRSGRSSLVTEHQCNEVRRCSVLVRDVSPTGYFFACPVPSRTACAVITFTPAGSKSRQSSTIRSICMSHQRVPAKTISTTSGGSPSRQAVTV